MSIPKPRSMPTGARNILRPNDSVSLWNCTLSPGWTQEESDILRNALIYYGIGNWKDVIEHGCLPDKTNAQMNLQLQRMLGQQSTAEFQNLHIDPYLIGKINSQKQYPGIRRKNGFIVNTGGKLSKAELKKRKQENKEKYEMPESEWKKIVLPSRELVVKNKVQEEIQKRRNELNKLEEDLEILLKKILKRRREIRGLPALDYDIKIKEEPKKTEKSEKSENENNENSDSSAINQSNGNNGNESSNSNSNVESGNNENVNNNIKSPKKKIRRRGRKRLTHDSDSDSDFLMPSSRRTKKNRTN